MVSILMGKKFLRSYWMREDQVAFLNELVEKEGERIRSAFVRKWIDVGIRHEKSKEEIFDYTEL